MRSACSMVLSRWAISSTVLLSVSRARARLSSVSVSTSIWEVGSSSTTMGAFLRKARAMARRWAWPPLSAMPWSPTLVLKPSGVDRM